MTLPKWLSLDLIAVLIVVGVLEAIAVGVGHDGPVVVIGRVMVKSIGGLLR